MSESELSQTIDDHILTMNKIEEENKKKAEAIETEDFEVASKCKKTIDSLKQRLLSPQAVQDLLKKKPVLTLLDLLLIVLDQDTSLNFTKNLLS